jgi:hypothetical protein
MDSAEAIPCGMGFPIRKFTDQRLLPPPRDLSQGATSFIAFLCQGIHRMPLRRLFDRNRRTQGKAPYCYGSSPRSRPCANALAITRRAIGINVERNDFRFDAILMFVRLCTSGLGRPNARPRTCGGLMGHGENKSSG